MLKDMKKKSLKKLAVDVAQIVMVKKIMTVAQIALVDKWNNNLWNNNLWNNNLWNSQRL